MSSNIDWIEIKSHPLFDTNSKLNGIISDSFFVSVFVWCEKKVNSKNFSSWLLEVPCHQCFLNNFSALRSAVKQIPNEKDSVVVFCSFCYIPLVRISGLIYMNLKIEVSRELLLYGGRK